MTQYSFSIMNHAGDLSRQADIGKVWSQTAAQIVLLESPLKGGRKTSLVSIFVRRLNLKATASVST